ncbi:dipeptidyl-peptidase 3 family protein [Saccharicrinis aurantiacus]|uniref:dipeptidyl-peptidase 3 family protein n=1 Tax=Saccharicrinis aurantiacus TaxID=1849719 RepID=UPI002492966B|nr:dihydrofolate reductase [Saccharicrinis aurantiacus]
MEVFAEKFDDIKILRFEVPGFENLPLKKKLYIYYLSQATLAGRDILWDQHCEPNLWLREILEAIYTKVNDKTNDDWDAFVVYLKKVWFSSGIHHHYSTDKYTPHFSRESFVSWCNTLGLATEHQRELLKVIFDENYLSKRVNSSPSVDMIQQSANNFYKGVSQSEVEEFYANQKANSSNKNLSLGLNSRLIKEDDTISEEVYSAQGKYANAISHIIDNLEKAKQYVENTKQEELISELIAHYQTGDLEKFDAYSIKWIQALDGDVDFINGFIETYGDPMGAKATWEGLVELIDDEETKKATVIAEKAEWFEANAPIDDSFKKGTINGISLKAIGAVMLGGDCYPASPLGINLPNAEWIREQYGSKSVTLTNIANAHHKASLSSGFLEEFTLTEEEVALEKKYGSLADNLHTHLHECVGHGSGKMKEGVTSEALKAYASPIEEARADLYGLYFMYHPYLIELGLIPNLDVAKAHFTSYIRNGLLTQITRIKLGSDVEQAHMRNRQLIAKWCFEKGLGEVIEEVKKEGKTYYFITDYDGLHDLFGELLHEIQRIKSEGDYESAKYLIETYGVKIDQNLHAEVLERFKQLEVPPFTGFLNPNMNLKYDGDKICDVLLDYNTNYAEQMLEYSENYGFLE